MHLHSSFGEDSIVLDSTEAPFSEKLMMGISSALITISMTSLGKGIATSMRSDLVGEYTELLTRVGKYEISGAKLAIKNGWMEKPPQTLDRRN
ncbi:DUF3231 family protein [Virgibacillus kekensis]|uniref:DUF3231 family protein n=1 Tax=Virgibacillus kekensis TaxID=202261 RepID=A0ABV9DNP6_9BACI